MDSDKILICGSTPSFPDDLNGYCSCGRPIVFRPYLAHIQKKLCMPCGQESMDRQKEPVQIVIDKKVRQEVNEYFNTKKN